MRRRAPPVPATPPVPPRAIVEPAVEDYVGPYELLAGPVSGAGLPAPPDDDLLTATAWQVAWHRWTAALEAWFASHPDADRTVRIALLVASRPEWRDRAGFAAAARAARS